MPTDIPRAKSLSHVKTVFRICEYAMYPAGVDAVFTLVNWLWCACGKPYQHTRIQDKQQVNSGHSAIYQDFWSYMSVDIHACCLHGATRWCLHILNAVTMHFSHSMMNTCIGFECCLNSRHDSVSAHDGIKSPDMHAAATGNFSKLYTKRPGNGCTEFRYQENQICWSHNYMS